MNTIWCAVGCCPGRQKRKPLHLCFWEELCVSYALGFLPRNTGIDLYSLVPAKKIINSEITSFFFLFLYHQLPGYFHEIWTAVAKEIIHFCWLVILYCHKWLYSRTVHIVTGSDVTRTGVPQQSKWKASIIILSIKTRKQNCKIIVNSSGKINDDMQNWISKKSVSY